MEGRICLRQACDVRVSILRFILLINELLLRFHNTNDVKIVKHFLNLL